MRRPRRRRGHREEPVSHDRWIISYADFITVLFAFFVVLFATSYQDNQAIRKLSRAIHLGFQQLGPLAGGQTDAKLPFTALPPGTAVTSPPAPLTNTGTSDETRISGIDIETLRRQLEAAVGQELRNHEIVTRVSAEGFVISLKELGFFDSGQAVLRPGAAEKIERIAKVLSAHGFELRVEGHSDDQPIHTAQFDSNWQLSTARAMAVLLHLVDDSGFDPTRISVAGYGQYRPIADNATPEGRKMNRRIDLVVVAPSDVPRPRQ
jgi:chemotaxis protein MotB